MKSLSDSDRQELIHATEAHRRERKTFDTSPIPGFTGRDYAAAATMIQMAMHHLDESIPNGQKRRTELAMELMEHGIADLHDWLTAKGYDMEPAPMPDAAHIPNLLISPVTKNPSVPLEMTDKKTGGKTIIQVPLHIMAAERDITAWALEQNLGDGWAIGGIQERMYIKNVPLPDHVTVPAKEANNYSLILSLLGMDEEGDPVDALHKLVSDPKRDSAVECLTNMGYRFEPAGPNYTGPFGPEDDLGPHWVAPFPRAEVLYTVGFVFDATGRVLLIKKNGGMPHLKGKWNGLGGKVEAAERLEEAMTRELKEEAGLYVPPKAWRRVAPVQFGPGRGGWIMTTTLLEAMPPLAASEEGEVMWWYPSSAYSTHATPFMANLGWMLGLCLDPERPSAWIDYDQRNTVYESQVRPSVSDVRVRTNNRGNLSDLLPEAHGYVNQDGPDGFKAELKKHITPGVARVKASRPRYDTGGEQGREVPPMEDTRREQNLWKRLKGWLT
jgi:8-oxo-dGTP diphosphatase